MRYLVTLILCLTLNFIACPQNLVSNGSFEEFEDCPTTPARLDKCTGWVSPTNATPDYFNACNDYVLMPENSPIDPGKLVKGSVGVPENVFGYQSAFEGEAYCGLFLIDWESFNNREYVQVRLERNLDPCEVVYISLMISLAETANFTVSEVSVCFSKKYPKVKKSKDCADVNSPHECELIICETGVDLELDSTVNTNEWTKLTGEYSARGGENVVTIGLFKGDLDQSDYLNWSKAKEQVVRERAKGIYRRRYAYYYIDDVSVAPMSNEDQDFTHY